eukprot:m.30793 g.30793  ORF g.30793 m.30793 type:complete len:461 (+) comp8240_c0_seq1:236-1618(+)
MQGMDDKVSHTRPDSQDPDYSSQQGKNTMQVASKQIPAPTSATAMSYSSKTAIGVTNDDVTEPTPTQPEDSPTNNNDSTLDNQKVDATDVSVHELVSADNRDNDTAKPTSSKTQTENESEESLMKKRVFVGNVSKNATNEKLAELLSQFGPVDVNVIMDREHAVTKGYGFATFKTEEQAKNCIRQKSLTFEGRELNFGPAKRRQTTQRNTGLNGRDIRSGQRVRGRGRGANSRSAGGQYVYANQSYYDGYQLPYMYSTEAYQGAATNPWLVRGGAPASSMASEAQMMAGGTPMAMDPRMYGYQQMHAMYYPSYYYQAGPAEGQHSEEKLGTYVVNNVTYGSNNVYPVSDASSDTSAPSEARLSSGSSADMMGGIHARNSTAMMTARSVLSSPGMSPGMSWAPASPIFAPYMTVQNALQTGHDNNSYAFAAAKKDDFRVDNLEKNINGLNISNQEKPTESR